GLQPFLPRSTRRNIAIRRHGICADRHGTVPSARHPAPQARLPALLKRLTPRRATPAAPRPHVPCPVFNPRNPPLCAASPRPRPRRNGRGPSIVFPIDCPDADKLRG